MIVVAGPGWPEVKKVEKIIDLDERRFALGAEHRVGRAHCRSCGADENVSDMVSGSARLVLMSARRPWPTCSASTLRPLMQANRMPLRG